MRVDLRRNNWGGGEREERSLFANLMEKIK